MTLSRPAARELLATSNLVPRRDLGQNFVVDPNTVRRIAHLARTGPGDHVVEVGAGLGSLTLALAEQGAEVLAVEVDPGLSGALGGVVADRSNVRVVTADAMTLDWTDLLAGAARWILVANLPYNIATPLVADLLDTVPAIERMLVMVQREVGERLAARARTAAYGAVSVKVAYWAEARVVGAVPASVFLPRPNVDSVLVEIVRRPPPAVDAPSMFVLVRTAFGQRRKMLRRSLRDVVTPEQFAAADVVPTDRPQDLDLDGWVRLTHASVSERPVSATALTAESSERTASSVSERPGWTLAVTAESSERTDSVDERTQSTR